MTCFAVTIASVPRYCPIITPAPTYPRRADVVVPTMTVCERSMRARSGFACTRYDCATSPASTNRSFCAWANINMPRFAAGYARANWWIKTPQNASTSSSTIVERSIRGKPERRITRLHRGVDGTLASLRRHPSDDLIRIRDVAGFAVHAVREVDHQFALHGTVRLFEHRLVHLRWTEVPARIAVLDGAAIATNGGVGDLQMTRLILFVHRAAVEDVGEFVERYDVVDDRSARFFRFVSAFFHAREAFFARKARNKTETAPAGEHAEAGIEHAVNQTVLESLMEVASREEFRVRPRLFELRFVRAQLRRVERACPSCLERRFGREHPGFHRQVHTFEAHAVEEAGGIAHQHQAVGVQARHRVQTAFGNRFCSVTQQFCSFEQFAHYGLRFEELKEIVRIRRGIFVVQPRDEADVQNVVRHAVDEAAAERVVRKRISHRVNDASGLHRSGRTLPQLFHARGINLRFASFVEAQTRSRLLCKRSARSFAKHDDFCEDIRARFVVRLRASMLVEPLVAGAHADDAIAVPKQLLTRKLAEDLRARFFRFSRKPLHDFLKRSDVLAVVVHHRRNEGRLQPAALR